MGRKPKIEGVREGEEEKPGSVIKPVNRILTKRAAGKLGEKPGKALVIQGNIKIEQFQRKKWPIRCGRPFICKKSLFTSW